MLIIFSDDLFVSTTYFYFFKILGSIFNILNLIYYKGNDNKLLRDSILQVYQKIMTNLTKRRNYSKLIIRALAKDDNYS